MGLRLLVGIWFQVLFHSPPGGLFTVPSRYSSLSVVPRCFALDGGPPCFPLGSSCPAVLWDPARLSTPSPTGVSPSSPRLPKRFGWHAFPFRRPSTPHARKHAVWAVPRSLAATWGISLDSFSSGYLDVSVRRVASLSGDGTLLPSGCPIRVRMDPCLPAAPHAFSQLAAPFVVPERQGIRHMPLLA